ncbi:VanZ family protein [Flavobacterium sp.]|uniref:VanZ family protein n=1 Tax=Flavobacterium sp. TaxID=239 RepID=UPI0037C0758D
MLNKKTYFLIAFCWTCLVTILSLIKISDEFTKTIDIDVEYKDKYVHFLFYLVFVLLWFLFIIRTKYVNSAKLKSLIFAVSYGIIIEICQGLYTTTRTPDVYDVLANSIGAFTGTLILDIFYKNTKTTP